MEHSPQYTSPKHTVFFFSYFFLPPHIFYIRVFFSSIKCQIEVLVLLIKKRVSLIYYHLDNRLLLYLGWYRIQIVIYTVIIANELLYTLNEYHFHRLRDKIIFNIFNKSIFWLNKKNCVKYKLKFFHKNIFQIKMKIYNK